MTIPITGVSSTSKDAFRQLVLKKNPNAPIEVLDLYFQLEPLWNIRADILVSQMCLETGYLTSWWSQPPRRNMAGIGVTGESSVADPRDAGWAYRDSDRKWYRGYSFSNWQGAVQAHYAHMSAYVYETERNNATLYDPRYSAARKQFAAKGWPLCRLVTDLNGKWAVPGTTYGQSIMTVLSAAAAFDQANVFIPNAPAKAPAEGAIRATDDMSLMADTGDNSPILQPVPGQATETTTATTQEPPASPVSIDYSDQMTAVSATAAVIGNGATINENPLPFVTVIRSVDSGSKLNLIGFTEAGTDLGRGPRWYFVSFAQGGGWIYSAYLQFQ